MEEIGKALKSIFDKLSDFFDIFDLSFFVSGFLTTSIIYLWGSFRNIALPSFPTNTSSVVAFILFCYINGLVTFALGRWIRKGMLSWIINRWRKWKNKREPFLDAFDDEFMTIIKAHSLDQHTTAIKYLAKINEGGIKRLYVRFWADLRDDEKYAKSLSLLRRYWVMSATYDGLSVSALISLLLLIEAKFGLLNSPLPIPGKLFYPVAILLIILFSACIREANRFVTYQMEEVAATIASKG